MMILVILYFILGYWATGQTVYRNKILFGTASGIFIQRLTLGFALGWILIPIALIAMLFRK